MHAQSNFSRRQFLSRTAALTAATALGDLGSPPLLGAGEFAPPVVVFSKIYHELHLSLDDSAALTAEVGLDGVDCPVRSSDQIRPERVREDLPRYVELLRQRHLQLPLLTTTIVSPETPHARDILTTARALGARYYRVGYTSLKAGGNMAQLIEQTRAQLQALAALNKEIGVCALVQNHSPSRPNGPLGGDLNDLFALVQDLPPDQVGVAFDLGHAILVHGDQWSAHFERLQPHIRVAYLKDVRRGQGFVRFGEGEFRQMDFFTRLKRMGYRAPLSLHIEYPWTKPGEPPTRAALAAALQDSLRVVRQWIAAA